MNDPRIEVRDPGPPRRRPPGSPPAAATPEARPVRREQERTKRTKQAILQAALVEFARHGFEGASTRRIADLAGITPALIGHHFGDKESLWKTVASHTFGRFLTRLQGRHADLEGVDDWTFLRMMLREYLLFFSEEPDFFRFVFHANQGDPERLNWLVDHYMAPSGKRYMALLARAQQAGWIVEGDLYSLRYLFWAAAGWMFACDRAFRRIAGQDPFDPAFIEAHVDLVLRLFLRPGLDTAAGRGPVKSPEESPQESPAAGPNAATPAGGSPPE